ncbi:Protein of unknown function [Nocardioides terrae]|uniref:Exopolyphosphatase n=1 Tax=Nocardioides terrae TaxID=574651 RepID=A0A1I1GXD3_9ACTN|nr:acyclic terpene utilization AtuA family protein [Nocardioides terrae]SFC13833.1 Protein of unknown function [Nocardioides terrae]
MTRSGVVRIGNCSGFYGDRLSAMRDQLEGGDLDFLTGDYLAELTMLILGRDQMKDASLGYAKTFVRQAEDCLGLALEKGVRIVSNAGGLNPAGLAGRLRSIAPEARIAYVEGDRVDVPGALTANAYLGGFGIARALAAGADIVVTGRVTDASLVVGPAVAHHGWAADDWDRLAGAVVAGHVLECGTQATGGNFSGFTSLPGLETVAGATSSTGDSLVEEEHRARPETSRPRPLGFPIAELAEDGSCVITKHDGTGGAVTVDTVTAQLMYEIQGPRYLGPDVTTDLTSIRLSQEGRDRVAISGVRGTPPPQRLKVAVTELGGFRNSCEFVLTGLDIDEKAAWIKAQVSLEGVEHVWSAYRVPEPDSPTEEGAACLLRLTAWAPTPDPLGKPFTEPLIGLALASYPGFHVTAPPTSPAPYGVYRADHVDRSAVAHTVVMDDGTREQVADPPAYAAPEEPAAERPSADAAVADSLNRRLPLGTFVHARSGDKGGDANLGLWVSHDADPALQGARVAWLTRLITPAKVRELVPESADLEIEVHPLPNLGGVNVLIRGLLGAGVAEGRRFDPQAKALGEWVRSRTVHIDQELL